MNAKNVNKKGITSLSKITSVLLIAVCLGLGYSCNKNNNFLGEVDNIPQLDTIVSATIYGLIVDDLGQPILNASISTNELQTNSDENGYFSLSGSLPQNGTTINVHKEGFSESHVTILPIADGNLPIKFTLIAQSISKIGHSADKISYDTDKIKITFQEAGFKNKDTEKVYDGDVSISTTYFNPLDDKFSSYFPGYLKTIKDNNTALIQPYGLINVELFGASNEQLQINKTATISMEIPVGLRENAPEEIPLWHFDTQEEVWIEDGMASRNGNFYEGEVAHFSHWCIALDKYFHRLSGKINKNELPYMNGTIEIDYPDKTSTFKGTTNRTGHYTVPIYKGEPFELTVLDECNSNLHNEERGIMEGHEIHNINIKSTSNSISIEGTLFNCNNEVIPNAYTLLYFDGLQDIRVLKTDKNGHYQLTLGDCNASSVFIKGYDVQEGLISDATEVSSSGTYDITACKNTFSGEMIIQIKDGETYVINDVVVTIMDSPYVSDVYLYRISTNDNFSNFPNTSGEYVKYRHGVHVNKDPNPELNMPPYDRIYENDQSDNPPVIYNFPSVKININELTEEYLDVTFNLNGSGFAFIEKIEGSNKETHTGIVSIKANIVQ